MTTQGPRRLLEIELPKVVTLRWLLGQDESEEIVNRKQRPRRKACPAEDANLDGI